MIVFVSGGARSGKSEVAEQLVMQAALGGNCYYIATAAVFDEEMAARVERHKETRNTHWITLEAPLVIDDALLQIPEGSAVLLDCLTLWASQVLYASELSDAQGMARLENAVHTARSRGHHLVLVSNDLNEDLTPADPETWRYVVFLQRLHRWLANEADSVLEVVAGRAIEWKPKEALC